MKLFSSFRARLILTIFPVVAGVTTGALLLAEWKFGATYQRLFEEQFENQISTVTQAKDRRFNALSSVLDSMAQKPELIAAMRQGDYIAAASNLRLPLESLAQERLQNELGNLGRQPPPGQGQGPDHDRERRDDRTRPFRDGPRPPNSSQSAPFIALVNAEGDFVFNQRQRPGSPFLDQEQLSGDSRRRSGKVPWFGSLKFAETLKQQEVGYLLVEAGEKRADQVREVFITPLKDPQDSKFLGAFVFGLPLPVITDRILNEQSKRSDYGEIMSGIYLEGKLVSTTVPENHRETVEKALAESLANSSKNNREILLPIADSKHRLIYRVLNPGSPFPQAVQVNLYSLAALQHEIMDLRSSAITLCIVALLVALILVMFVSRGLSGPISTLVTATQEIERGNYDIRVPVTRDEVGHLAHAFNDMAAGLALQEKYRSVLNAVADRTVADRLLESREALSGELRDVTMLFCDIRGFTALTEKMPPGEVIELLNEHMTLLTQVAYAHGGIVDKFVGDLIMVLFGAPLSTEKDALRAVECAQTMIRARREQNASCRQPLEIGIGIATGSVVAGCMGSEQRLSYTVLGHRVNLASRLCSVAQAGEIVVDAETAGGLEGHMSFTPLPAMQLKGFSEAVQVFLAA